MSERLRSGPPASTCHGRKRGVVLERVLFDATLTELADHGYTALTMGGIAARARTGKASLYSRWASKRELLCAALVSAVPPLPAPSARRSARENLLGVLTAHRDLLAGKTGFPGLNVIAQLLHEPALRAIFVDSVIRPRLTVIDSILRTAVEQGEIDSASVTPWSVEIGPALISQHFILTGRAPTRRELILILDTVMRPRAVEPTADR